MNSQDFLILNVVGAGAFLVWYLLSRGGSQAPTKLNLKAKETAPTVLEPLAEDLPPILSSERQVQTPVVDPFKGFPPAQARAKNLNVMFNYNGHSWDAYEVLGVPAGSSIRLVTEAYQTALRRCDRDSIEFLETAYQAILQKR